MDLQAAAVKTAKTLAAAEGAVKTAEKKAAKAVAQIQVNLAQRHPRTNLGSLGNL